MIQDSNIDAGVTRSWDRLPKGVSFTRVRGRGHWHWGLVHGDPLLHRQAVLVREGRHTLHNVIRGEHGLPNSH